MYRLIPSEPTPEHATSARGLFLSLGLIVLLSVLGFASVVVIGYYLPDTAAKSYWFISRSSGVVAYVLLTIGVLWGLVQSGALFRSRVAPLLSLGLHSYLNWLALGLAALHGAILVKDNYIQIDFARVVTPFLAEYRPVPVGLGIIGFYLMLLLSLSFYARSHLGQRAFRLLHYTSFGVFIMVTLHGLLAGTDSGALGWLYAASLVAVVVLTVMRIASTRNKRKPASRPVPATGALGGERLPYKR